jgi:endonuclease/exonuclease/phosphatase family metal-dependent hydrolase
VAAQAAAAEGSLRVVTLNLLHGGPWSGLAGDARDLRARLEMVTRGLRALEPDIVGLQEAERVFSVRALGRLLVRILGFSEGPAILSPDGTPLWPSDHYGVLAEIALD